MIKTSPLKGTDNRRSLKAIVLPSVAAAAVVLLAILAGLSSRPSQNANYRAIGFELDGRFSELSSYPGWNYDIPLIVMALFLVAATLLALSRISAASRLALESLGEADDYFVSSRHAFARNRSLWTKR